MHHHRPRTYARALLALVAGALLAALLGPAPADAKRDNKSYEYRFEFVNGQVITGSSEDNTVFLPGAGGSDPFAPIGMEVHVSCSDEFPDGWGEKDGPDRDRDSAWQIAYWEVTKFKNGRQDKQCSGGTPTPPGTLPPFEPPPPPGGNPAVDLIKRVNGEDANDPTGPVVLVGETVTLTYEVINTGDVTLIDIEVIDEDLGAIVCPSTTLDPGESMDCAPAQVDVVEAGQVMMKAHVHGVAEVSLPEPPAPAGDDKGYGWSIAFVNGQVITGTSEKNTAFVAEAGGTDVDNPIGMEVHVSCSDDFPDGWGEKDGPDRDRDSAWQIASYEFVKYDKGKIKKTCGDAFEPVQIKVEDWDPIHYFAEEGYPAIDLEKLVGITNSRPPVAPGDYDDPDAPLMARVGEELVVEYHVTNIGETTLNGLFVFDFTEGMRPCATMTLAPGESTTCLVFNHVLTFDDVGKINMQALAIATGAGEVVFDIDPVNVMVLGT